MVIEPSSNPKSTFFATEDKGQRKVSSVIKGELKLSLEYRRDVLHVMVNHARSLDIPDGSKEEPNSYVKVYLRPDPHKTTKRKTRVVRKNCHPSFMEMVSGTKKIITVNVLADT